MSHVQLPLYVGHKTSVFGVHEGGKLMVAACLGKREHLDGKHVLSYICYCMYSTDFKSKLHAANREEICIQFSLAPSIISSPSICIVCSQNVNNGIRLLLICFHLFIDHVFKCITIVRPALYCTCMFTK